MKYTVIPGVILTKICDEDFLVATGSARGRVPYVEGINSTNYFAVPLALTFSQKFLMGFPQKKL